MTTQKEQTQDAKMIQLALYREYGFQPENRVPLLSVPMVARVVLGGSLLVALCFHRVPGLKRLI